MTSETDFESMELGDAPEPAQLVTGAYEAKLSGVEKGKSSKKGTPYFRFNFTVLGVKDVDDDALSEAGGEAEMVNKTVNTDFYWLSPNALFNLKRFVKRLGVDYDEEIKGLSIAKAHEALLSKLQDEEFTIRVRREPLENADGTTPLDEDDNPITRAIVTSAQPA